MKTKKKTDGGLWWDGLRREELDRGARGRHAEDLGQQDGRQRRAVQAERSARRRLPAALLQQPIGRRRFGRRLRIHARSGTGFFFVFVFLCVFLKSSTARVGSVCCLPALYLVVDVHERESAQVVTITLE